MIIINPGDPQFWIGAVCCLIALALLVGILASLDSVR